LFSEFLKSFEVGGLLFLAATLRYLLMTGAYYSIVSVWFKRNTNQFKINPSRASNTDMRNEIFWALLNNVNFFFMGVGVYFLYRHGLLKIYFDIHEVGGKLGWLYAILIVPVVLILHDAYFFWSHYLMHRTPLKKYSHHHVHHQFHNISPWAAFSVHPAEGFIEVLVRPLILMTIPLHPYSIIAFAIITFGLNIIGHSGYEFFPEGYPSSPLTRLNSCATFHYIHHKHSGYHFGLFLTFWDRLMGTMHPEYEALYSLRAKNNFIRLPQKIFLRENLQLSKWINR
jgi:lathosterol oxidase